MADRTEYLNQAREIWSQVRAFCMLWLAFTSLGGFVVLVGGPWILALLSGMFGPAAAEPGRITTLLMLSTLPLAIYFFLQQRRLSQTTVVCTQCGERYSNRNSSCPMCGCARPAGDAPAEKKPVAATKS